MTINVLLLTVDALRQDMLGCYGSRPSLTPQIDLFAGDAVRFNQAMACGGWTRPSLIGLLSSTYPSMYGGSWGSFHPERPSLPEILQAAGITTAAFISNPQVGSSFGFSRGFDVFDELQATYSGPKWAHRRGAQRALRSPYLHSLLGALSVATAPPSITATASELTAQAKSWLAGRSDPFFTWIHYMDTHWPYHISQELSGGGELAQAWSDLHNMYIVSQNHGWLHPGQRQLQQLKGAYRRAIKYVDTHIGHLLDSLARRGLLDSTAVIFTADHGEEFFEHGRWGHYQLFEENIRVPLLIRLPGRRGRTITQLVSLLDVAPTILKLFGFETSSLMLGRSLLPVMHGSTEHSVDDVYVESMWPNNYRLAIRTKKWKYRYETEHPDEASLYDLISDPAEKYDLWPPETSLVAYFEDLRQKHEDLASRTRPLEPISEIEKDEVLHARLQALGYIE